MGLYLICFVRLFLCYSVLISLLLFFFFKIFRTNLHNFIKFCLHFNIHETYVGIVTCHSRGGCLLVSCVPMREQKNDEKGFFRVGQCAALSSFRVGKMLFCRKRVCVLQILQKGCRIREYAF